VPWFLVIRGGFGWDGTVSRGRSGCGGAVIQARSPDCQEPRRGDGCTLSFTGPQGKALRFTGPQGKALRFTGPQGKALRFTEPQGKTFRFTEPQGKTFRFTGPQGKAFWFAKLKGKALRFTGPQGKTLRFRKQWQLAFVRVWDLKNLVLYCLLEVCSEI
jgi:hypothetical protein